MTSSPNAVPATPAPQTSAPDIIPPDIILEARDITRRYPGNVALNKINYRAYRGKINVLIGENGAGKSTLMRILSGVEQADEGQLLLNSCPVSIRSPREAAHLGIAIVHQELSVMHNMTVSDNIFAGRELTSSLLLDRGLQTEQSNSALKKLRQHISPGAQAGQLSLGSRQLVELARTLAHSASILILDEPTSALSRTETDSLFQVLAELKRAGVTIIYISHRLHELLYLGDFFTVLRSGNIVGQAPRSDISRQWIVDCMTGRTGSEEIPLASPPIDREVVLSVRDLAVSALDRISFSLHRGQILGFYGLLGSGRTELMDALAGARRLDGGEVRLQDRPLSGDGVEHAIRQGITLVPEDRQRDGLVQSLSVRENIALAGSPHLFLSRARETSQIRSLADSLNIVPRDLDVPITSLSGGNQQKVLIARCLLRKPKVLLLDEPTRGVDVGARAEIYRTLRSLAQAGLGIVFTSSEVDETRALADRAFVLRQGSIAAEMTRDQITDEALFSAASPLLQPSETPALHGATP